MKSTTVSNPAKMKVVFQVNREDRYRVIKIAKRMPKKSNKTGNQTGVELKVKNKIMNKAEGKTARYHLPPDLGFLSSKIIVAHAKTARTNAAAPP
jgi:hypothetical protein